MDDQHSVPAAVDDLIAMARKNVAKVIGIEPDFSPETLPLVDQYLRQVPRDTPKEVQTLILAAVGCYFGEVTRRKFNGRWNLSGSSPPGWRIELESCPLCFWPVGMTGEIFAGTQTEDYDGSFVTADEFCEGLEAMLSAAPPISEEEYYSLSGRIDILHLAADWLTGQSLSSGKPHQPYSTDDYRQIVDGRNKANTSA